MVGRQLTFREWLLQLCADVSGLCLPVKPANLNETRSTDAAAVDEPRGLSCN